MVIGRPHTNQEELNDVLWSLSIDRHLAPYLVCIEDQAGTDRPRQSVNHSNSVVSLHDPMYAPVHYIVVTLRVYLRDQGRISIRRVDGFSRG